MKILATTIIAALGALLFAPAGAQAASQYHAVTVTGVVEVQTPVPALSSTLTEPIPVSNKFILKQVIAASGTGSGLTLANLDIVISDSSQEIDVIETSGSVPTIVGQPVATIGNSATNTIPVVTQNHKGATQTFVESGYTFSITANLPGGPHTFNISADVLFKQKYAVGGVTLNSEILSFFGGGTSGTPHFYFTGDVKTKKKTYNF